LPTARGAAAKAGGRLWFRVVALVGVPVLLLVITEVALRLGGFGYPTSWFLERQVEGRAVLTDNPDFGRRFFPPGLVRYPRPMTIPAVKPADAVRIFVLGESAAMGDPDPKFGLPRMLEVLLGERFPGRQIEVINMSMVAVNSHVVLPVARECARKNGDLWVIFMGNNEMIGPFGSLSVFGARTPPLVLIRAGLALQRTRLGQGLAVVVHWLRARNQPPSEWGGMAMMAHQTIRRNDPRTIEVYRNFEDNLGRILEAGRHAGVPIVLCSVATNLKDCAPFASLSGAELSDAELAEWRAHYDQGMRFESAGDWAAASDCYRQAAEIDEQHAELAFRWARCSLELGQPERARELFRQARDQDALQFRTDTELNERIRKLAMAHADRMVHFLDTEALFEAISPAGVPGREFFLEHVHLNPEGNYLLARAVAEQVVKALALEPVSDGLAVGGIEADRSGGGGDGTPWRSLEECLGLLGFTDWNRHHLLTTIAERMEQPPFTQQLDHAQQLEGIRRHIEGLRLATKPAQLQRAAQRAAHSVARRPDDADLRWNLAQLLDLAGDAIEAEAQWRAVIRLWPYTHLPYYNLARLLENEQREVDARQVYLQCLELKPDYFEARYSLGSLLTRVGQPAEAARHLRLAVRQKPHSVPARLALGIALTQANRPAQAEPQFREVLRLDPENLTARQHLDTTTD
jgi:tetratricopeptide (TPR) repeat protein